MFNDRQIIAQSVEDQNDSDYPSHRGHDASGFFWVGAMLPESDILSPWGYPARHYELRRSWYGLYNTLPVSAMTNLVRRWVGTNWELRSEGKYKPRVIRKWQERLQNVEFGGGWSSFLWKVGQDYLSQDLGAFIEIIGRGRADMPLRGEVMGIKALDALRCYPTGDPEYPVWYQSHKTGSLHKMHFTRVRRIVDNPSPDPAARGMGLSATSRLFSTAHVQQLIQRYRVEKMGDLPPKGIISVSGINQRQWEEAMLEYENQRFNDNQEVFRNMMKLQGIDPGSPVEVNITPFSTLPDGFNYREYTEIDVNTIALAIGDDPQEIWPLTGQGLGNTATQSTTLHKKAKAKTYGAFLSELERIFNIFILPPELQLTFNQRDEDQDKSSADAAKMWTGVALDLKNSTGMSNEQVAEFLARVVPEVGDVLLNASGELILLTDIDEPAPEQIENAEIELDEQDTPEGETDDMPTDGAMVADDDTLVDQKQLKAIQATRSDFENDFEDIIIAANNRTVTRRRANPRLRSIIARDINKAFRDGLEENGVSESELSADDRNTIERMVRTQSSLVSSFLDKVYTGDGLSEAELAGKPAMWWNGSIQPAYNAGRMSADRNGMYEFYGRVKADSCTDCKRMKGQIHRFKDYQAKNLDVPHVGQDTECEGYRCVDRLVKRPGERARGRF